MESSLRTLGFPSRNGDGSGTVPIVEMAGKELKEAARGIRDGYVRIMIRRTGKPRVVVHRHEGFPYSKGQIRKGISVTTVPARMAPVEAVQSRVKSSERLASVLARLDAPTAVEVLRIGPLGVLTEGTISNLFLVKENRLVTPPAWLGVLEGVTRAQVIEAARRMKIPVQEMPVTRHDLFNADEAFLTNVLVGILPMRQVDGRAIGAVPPGPVTQQLLRAIKVG